MNRTEIQEFKRFLNVRELFTMFSQNYNKNHMTFNPPTLEAYLEKTRAECVIPLSGVTLEHLFAESERR